MCCGCCKAADRLYSLLKTYAFAVFVELAVYTIAEVVRRQPDWPETVPVVYLWQHAFFSALVHAMYFPAIAAGTVCIIWRLLYDKKASVSLYCGFVVLLASVCAGLAGLLTCGLWCGSASTWTTTRLLVPLLSSSICSRCPTIAALASAAVTAPFYVFGRCGSRSRRKRRRMAVDVENQQSAPHTAPAAAVRAKGDDGDDDDSDGSSSDD